MKVSVGTVGDSLPAKAPVGPLGPLGPLGPDAVEGSPETDEADETAAESDTETGTEDEIVTGEILDEVSDWLSRFIVTNDPYDIDLLTLWAAHTYLCMETYTTPRLIIDSPIPECGKTTVLEHLQRLCLAPIQMAVLSSPALITRMLDKGLRTILIDEADRSLDPKMDKTDELLAVLNSGYKRGATRPVLVPDGEGGHVAVEMPTFSPVVMAGNNPQLPDDTRSRSVRVLLMPDIDGEAEESDWEMIEDKANELGRRLSVWADQVRDDVKAHRPELPGCVKNRAREKWSPLNRVAFQAGGHWPKVVEVMSVRDVERARLEKEEGLGTQKPSVLLLQDIQEVWGQHPEQVFLPTDTLVGDLVRKNPTRWGMASNYGKDLTPHRLGKFLVGSYDIHSVRPEHDGQRGYSRQSFDQAWRVMGMVK